MSKPVALITGGGKRIGAAVSKKLMEMGWYVLIHVNSSVDEASEIASIISKIIFFDKAFLLFGSFKVRRSMPNFIISFKSKFFSLLILMILKAI